MSKKYRIIGLIIFIGLEFVIIKPVWEMLRDHFGMRAQLPNILTVIFAGILGWIYYLIILKFQLKKRNITLTKYLMQRRKIALKRKNHDL
ncbi:hypothetical protein [Companilactobacillus metriopterae]|uniref:hypothetical protein n=1 Tax=Companilactobacillus metriopterae TaxID=1909267 RepID=UPI00100B8D19|nr:hypothetical protein [Companilactobacillus metriopterae]